MAISKIEIMQSNKRCISRLAKLIIEEPKTIQDRLINAKIIGKIQGSLNFLDVWTTQK